MYVFFVAKIINDAKTKAEKEGKTSDLNVICIPSSFQARQLILENNLNLGSLDTHSVVYFNFICPIATCHNAV